MKLLIDAGNTRLKWCWYDGEDIPLEYSSAEYEDFDAEGIELFKSPGHDTEEILICNVAGEEAEADFISVFQEWQLTPVFMISAESACGIRNAYADPGSLGADRWLSMLGAWTIVKDAVCVVDCGTAVTIDVLDDTGLHRGGMIIPGLEMMQDALTENTGIELSEEDQQNPDSILATNTTSAVEAGTLYAVVALIDRVRQDIERELDMTIPLMLTGGDVDLVQPLLSGESQHEPMLVFQGMIALDEMQG